MKEPSWPRAGSSSSSKFQAAPSSPSVLGGPPQIACVGLPPCPSRPPLPSWDLVTWPPTIRPRRPSTRTRIGTGVANSCRARPLLHALCGCAGPARAPRRRPSSRLRLSHLHRCWAVPRKIPESGCRRSLPPCPSPRRPPLPSRAGWLLKMEEPFWF